MVIYRQKQISPRDIAIDHWRDVLLTTLERTSRVDWYEHMRHPGCAEICEAVLADAGMRPLPARRHVYVVGERTLDWIVSQKRLAAGFDPSSKKVVR